ncbi:TPA: hypothetical protein NKR29_004586 [Vibrio parahaemolyticus]|nr:hypothetical protein [Vibrio parahaemolyticus]HCG5558673.1 hypothetical protein [Vibrio parahaemolyticus]HCG7760897.1 hypothetical protein [Vibrio parahaemolyticus]HCH1723124.1 hypothetical protein [Vibrio parahaemolyticus]
MEKCASRNKIARAGLYIPTIGNQLEYLEVVIKYRKSGSFSETIIVSAREEFVTKLTLNNSVEASIANEKCSGFPALSKAKKISY